MDEQDRTAEGVAREIFGFAEIERPYPSVLVNDRRIPLDRYFIDKAAALIEGYVEERTAEFIKTSDMWHDAFDKAIEERNALTTENADLKAEVQNQTILFIDTKG